METRKLYKQGKSTVLVIPTKYLKSLEWTPQDIIILKLLPNKTLNLERWAGQRFLPGPTPDKPEPTKELIHDTD